MLRTRFCHTISISIKPRKKCGDRNQDSYCWSSNHQLNLQITEPISRTSARSGHNSRYAVLQLPTRPPSFESSKNNAQSMHSRCDSCRVLERFRIAPFVAASCWSGPGNFDSPMFNDICISNILQMWLGDRYLWKSIQMSWHASFPNALL